MEILVDISLYLAYGLLVSCLLAAVGWTVFHLIDGGKNHWIKPSIAVGGISVLFFTSYLIASDNGHVCDCSQLAGGLLIMTYIVLALNCLGVLSLLVSKYLR